MRVLLDTHVLLWLATSPERVPPAVRQSLFDADERIVSSASAYEISYKARAGKLPVGDSVMQAWPRLLIAQQATELPLTVAHMARAGSMAWEHRDPFDRILVAQTQTEGLQLATGDRRILDFPGAPVLRWE